MTDKQWKLLCKLGMLYNNVIGHVGKQSDFNKFVVKNKKKLNFPQAVEILMTNINVADVDFVSNNLELCKTAYELLMIVGIDKLNFREAARASCFIETIKKFHETNPIIK